MSERAGSAAKARRVVVYGRSLTASAIAASLQGRSELELVQLDEATPQAARRLRESHPDAVICELRTTPLDFVFALLEAYPGLPVVGVDLDSDRLLVLSSRRPLLLATDDLVGVIVGEEPTKKPNRADACPEQRRHRGASGRGSREDCAVAP